MPRYRIAEETRVELLEDTWVAFSGKSGDTVQLNVEAAAMMELLAQGPADALSIGRALARDAQTDPSEVIEAMHHVWDQLIDAGLLRIESAPAHNCG